MQQAIIAGDTLQFTTTIADYKASDGWTLKFRLIPRSSGSAITITAAADDDDPDAYEVSVSAATTADWAPGDYSWAAWVEKGAEKFTVDGWASVDGRYRGGASLAIKPDPRIVATFDNRSTARKVLDGLLALHESHAAGQGLVASYTIANRTMQFRNVADLLAQIRYWRAEVADEERRARIAAGQDSGGTLRVRM